MNFYVRVGEHNKSDAQIEQREATYKAAKFLRQNGIECEVREWFTGKDATADTASIVLTLPHQ